ncbi:MAG: DUF349 domain-containing protein [Wenzhouxiangellaceae bacterium]|nr:DUF349 domain-containing protein [Wenzhouxiangellaceae bacterium]
MSLKERLFGPAWESKDPAVRIQSVNTGMEQQLFASLPEIARKDADASVRLAALRRLNDESAWLQARLNETDEAIRSHADQYLLRRACAEPAADGLEHRLGWQKTLTDADSIRRLAREGADAPIRRAALARIESPGFLGDCYVAETDEEIATELLERIDQVSTLKRISSALRKRHKHRHQAVMHRLARLEGDTGSHDARDELTQHLIDKLEQLARGEFSGDRLAQADHLQNQWNELPDPDPAAARRFEGAMKIVRSALKPKPKVAPAVPEKVVVAEARSELTLLTEKARNMAAQPASDETDAALNALMSDFDRAWNATGSPSQADLDARIHFSALAGELQARQQALRNRPPTRTKTESDADGSRPEPAATADPQLIEALNQALQTAEQSLEAGHISDAASAVDKARSAFDRLAKKHQPRAVPGELARMAGKLKEMRDWQHWSNNKLRERLIERVGEIDVAGLHPDAVTARLKELRERWKELDQQEVMPGDKRQFSAPQGQWRRFQKACNEVFESARPFLEKRSEVRDQSLQELKDFLVDARQVADDAEASSDKLIRYQRAARQAIRNLDTLPPKARGKMASTLRGLMDDISAALDKHFDAIESEKRRLIAEACKLAHEKDRAVAIDRAKSLQAEWKKAGHSRRKVDDKLWREFREPIDPLFEELKKARDEHKQAEKAQTEELKALCARAEELVDSETDELESLAGPLTGLEREFNGFSPIPPGLRKRFDQATARYRKRMDDLRQQREQQKRAHLDKLIETLQDTWKQRAAGKPVEPLQDLPQVPDGDALGQSLLERLQRFADSEIDTGQLTAEVQALTGDARQVVIEMECLAGVETPEEDRRQRMDYQINRLSHRLADGAPRPDLGSERTGLQQRWLESLPHQPDQHGKLKKRFEAAEKILKQMTA